MGSVEPGNRASHTLHCCEHHPIMGTFINTFILLLIVCMVRTFPQVLTESEFKQEGKILSGEGEEEVVLISGGYTKTRRQGRAGYTEVIHHMGPNTVHRSYETELETEEILAKIDHVNNALTQHDDTTINIDIEDESESRADDSKNIFQVLWEQILSG